MSATEKTLAVVKEMASAMEEHRRHLTKLDSQIGDGDHGNNMHRGFGAAIERLGGTDPATPSDALKAVSMALISKVGGAAGPLYGTKRHIVPAKRAASSGRKSSARVPPEMIFSGKNLR